MRNRFRYPLEAALGAARTAEDAAGRRHASEAARVRRGAELHGALLSHEPGPPAPDAGRLAARECARERALAACERDLAAARPALVEARQTFLAAHHRRERLEADRARRAVVFLRERALRDERRRFIESLCSPGAFAFASETASL